MSVLKEILLKWILFSTLVVFGSMSGFSSKMDPDGPHPKGPPGGAWQQGDKKWPPPGPDAWMGGGKKWPGAYLLEETLKRFERTKSSNKADPESEFLFPRVSDLLDRSKAVREKPFQLDRLLNAANALLNASDFISWSRKMEKMPHEKDFWGVTGGTIQFCYFRVQQADFFAPLSGEKNSEKYITMSRTLYQQARGAYDAHEYQKAKLLADASISLVVALESIAQASIPIPEPHIPK
jgi:hypothetical protein